MFKHRVFLLMTVLVAAAIACNMPAFGGAAPEQTATEPPTIVLFVRGGDIGADYLRYLENRLREEYDFMGTPLRLTARRRHDRRQS